MVKGGVEPPTFRFSGTALSSTPDSDSLAVLSLVLVAAIHTTSRAPRRRTVPVLAGSVHGHDAIREFVRRHEVGRQELLEGGRAARGRRGGGLPTTYER